MNKKTEKEKTKRQISEIFLLTIVRELIKNSYSEENKLISEMPAQGSMMDAPIQMLQLPPLPPLPSKQMTIQQPKIYATQTFTPIKQSTPLTNQKKQNGINLGKLTNILQDPSVLGVECPGPSKNVLVNRSGAIQATGLTLSKEEIDAILNEISEKTRLPLISGLFKAAIKDLLVTAVISEFVGTRFMIQKKNPFMKY